MLQAIHLLLTEDSALEKTIEKIKAEKQKVAPRLRSDVDPELISRRETLEKAISVLRKINYLIATQWGWIDANYRKGITSVITNANGK